MAEARNRKSTASLTTTRVRVKILKQDNPSPGGKTRIYNEYGKPIFLIPISCTSIDDAQSAGKILEKLAKKIPVGKYIDLSSDKYDHNERESGSQICILFRAGDDVHREEFLQTLCDKSSRGKGVKLEPGEKFRLHGQLSNSVVYLKQVGAVQVVSDEKLFIHKDGEEKKEEVTCTETQEDLKKAIKALQKGMADLQKGMTGLQNGLAALVKALESFDQKRT